MSILNTFKRLFSTDVYYIVNNDEPSIENFDIHELYKTQANLRTVVSFIAEQSAQLPIKVFERKSDTDRQRNTTCATARLLAKPNAYQTRYEFIEQSFSEYLLYGECVWFLHESKNSTSGYELEILPENWLLSRSGGTVFSPDTYTYASKTSGVIEVPTSNLIIFHNYNPQSPSSCLSPIHALKQTLLEQIESNRYRKQIWKNGGRMSAYITRPKDVERWDDSSAERFKRDIRDNWTSKGSMAGGMPVLEDGMEIKTVGFSAREQEWSKASELSREDICGVYHVSPAVIWSNNSQTYASAKDNARALYSDCLMLYLTRFQERITQFLMPALNEAENLYAEFDIQAKLQGSFEEQANILTSAVGAPWLSRNEARARQNLPAIDGGDEIVTPLNVAVGGSGYEAQAPQNQYTNSATHIVTKTKDGENEFVPSPEGLARRDEVEAFHQKYIDLFNKFYTRQLNSVKSSYMARAKDAKDTNEWYNMGRWNKELSTDLYNLAIDDAESEAHKLLLALGYSTKNFSRAQIENYIKAMAEGRAIDANAETLAQILAMQTEKTDWSDIVGAIVARSLMSGSSFASALLGFSQNETIKQLGERGNDTSKITKTWTCTSAKPRLSHQLMNGETVGWKQHFSNGAYYPGDSKALDAADVCNCKCICVYTNSF